jgi:hypothetical protein
MALVQKDHVWSTCGIGALLRVETFTLSACVHNVKENGSQAYQQLLRRLFDELFLPD